MQTFIWLAQINQELELFKDAFIGGESPHWLASPVIWAWTLGICGLLIAWISGWSIVRHDQAEFGPTNRRICVEFGLVRSERKLLQSIAKTAGFKHVASLLISEGCFDYAADVQIKWQGANDRLNQIKTKIFGS